MWGTRFILLSLFFCSYGYAVTESLPGGVRALVYKHTEASISSTFNSWGAEKSFDVHENLGPSILAGISNETREAIEELRALDPSFVDNLSLGLVNLQPKITASANTFAVAYGITDWLMLAAGIPRLRASVTLNNDGFIRSDSFQQIAKQLRDYSNRNNISSTQRERALALAQILEQLPPASGGILQGIIINDYHYKPVGNWSAEDFGDAQAYAQIKTFNGETYKNAVKLTTQFPTGKKDDPDNLLDIPFGNGYYSGSIATLHDFNIWRDNIISSLSATYTHNFSTTKTFRLSPSTAFPLSPNKEDINYKPGDAVELEAGMDFRIYDELRTSGSFQFKEKFSDTIRGQNANYDYSILSADTNSQSKTVELGLSYSTTKSYLRKKFPIPFKVSTSYSKIYQGINTDKLSLWNFGMEMYF